MTAAEKAAVEAMARAIADSRSLNREFPDTSLWDLLDFSGENAARMVMDAAATAALAALHALPAAQKAELARALCPEVKPDMWSEVDDPENSASDPSEWAACAMIGPGEVTECTPWLALPSVWIACREGADGANESRDFPTREEAEAWAALAQSPAEGDADHG